MAEASPSPLASSTATANGSKLLRLLVDGGTAALRETLNKIYPASKPVNFLKAKRERLKKLLDDRVLNRDQWYQLYPKDGSDPDPEKFDISLLFLLLTEICGLEPPRRTGWNNMPQAKDRSLSANLVRLKLFRNKLLHRPNTHFETDEFLDLWKKLSGVLCSLGLSSSDIEKLKLESYEGENYVEILLKWADSEEDVIRRLKAMHDTQIETRKAVKGLEMTRQQDQKTLQDIKSNVDELLQIQRTRQDTHQTVSKAQQTQMEATNLQQEDHQTLQDSQQVVGNLPQMQKEAVKLQQLEHRILEDTHQVVERAQPSVQDTQQMVEEVLRTHQETQQQINDVAADTKERRDNGKEDEALKKLAKVDTEGVIQYHSSKYQEGTRLHIFEKIKLWLDDRTSENRVMVISGDAGMGKSVISAVVCQRMRNAGRLSGSHFCHHDKACNRNPKIMLQSLAYQLSELLPQYKRELVKALSRNLGEEISNLEVGELFELLFEEPLRKVDDPGKSLLMVIDGLDESEYKGRNKLLDVIDNHFFALPVWFRFCVTTRPEIVIAKRLQKLNPLHLQQDDEENVRDIRIFFETQLGNVIQSGSEEVVIDELVRKADGHILYAYLMVDSIKKNVLCLTTDKLVTTLPTDVSGFYESYFERLKGELEKNKELTITVDQFFTFLSALVAVREPLPLDFVSKLLLSDTKSPAGHWQVRKAIECISTLLPVQDGCIHFFHKSVKDWLTDRAPDMYGMPHKFYVKEKWGHLALSQRCADELDDVKRKSIHGTDFSENAKYAIQHGVYHMLESEEVKESTRGFEEIVNNFVIDLAMVYAKLRVHNTASSEDIILSQKQKAFYLLSSESQNALGTLLFLLRKYHARLATNPSGFFQVMVNEGGDVLAGEATELLQTKYHQIPYMEYIHKGAIEEEMEVQAMFRCTSQVACFDISPQQELMVCECMDVTIQLWSLQTGKQIWKRPVTVEKRYVDDLDAFRMVPNSSVLSCYRSVIFHPTEPIVLSGILSHAYSIDGDFLPLFPNSNCKFTVCSVNGDSMITDFPGDAKCLVMWSLKNGEEITRTIRDQVVLSFAWSPDRKLLAISHLPGLVCLVDALNGFETLAEVTTFKPCGMIKFAPNLKFLFCWCKPVKSIWETQRHPKGIRLNVTKLPCDSISLNVVNDNVDYEPWDYESSSKAGFLMGDPVSCLFRRFRDIWGPFWILAEGAFAFVLSKQSVLRVFPGNNCIAMFSPDEMKIARTTSCRRLRHVSFAVDGKSVYGVTEDEEAAVVSFDVSSGKLNSKIETSTCRDLHYPKLPFRALNYSDNGICLVTMTNGVLLKQRHRRTAVQLWNFELSQQVRSWPSLCEVTYMMPVTDHCVACVGRRFEVNILDTLSGDIVKTISLCHEGYKSTCPIMYKEAIECNSKFQLLSTARDSVQLTGDKGCLWERGFKDSLLYSWNLPGMFSPTEKFVLISAKSTQSKQEVHVLDAFSGKTLRTLCTVDHIFNCAFVSETECVIDCQNKSESFCLRLFNIMTGELLSSLYMENRPACLSSFPQEGLIAIGLWQSNRMCAFVAVRRPRDKVCRKAKVRIAFVDKNDFRGFFHFCAKHCERNIEKDTACFSTVLCGLHIV